MQQKFVHLKIHTEYSLCDGLVRIKPLMQTLASQGMHAVALTDFCNLFAVVKFFQAAINNGIKPIIGCDVSWFYPEQPGQMYSAVLLCQNETGYLNLTRLVSKAYQEGQVNGKPTVNFNWIKDYKEGLILLSGAKFGDIGQALLAGDENKAKLFAKRWAEIFPNAFYLEITRTQRIDEEKYNAKVIKLAEDLNLALVATNDVRFLNEEDFDAHEARVCIHEGLTLEDPRRNKLYSTKQYLRSEQEMCELFKDLPEALENTVEISKRCTVKIETGKNYLPNFPVPHDKSVAEHLCNEAMNGLEERLCQIFKNDKSKIESERKRYDERLQLELTVINKMGFAGYFLIVADFIKWAKGNDVPVGPGRGSGAGSLVAFALYITDLDPLFYELLFERFLNPERVSMPDFDIDFCMQGRDRVIEYVAQKYGRKSVSQIITFGTMAAKAVIRDVGRVLAYPYNFVDKIAKLIPFEIGMTLTKALEQEEELRKRYKSEDEVKELFTLALKLEGITRNAGKHAGGVVIAPSELTDFTAIYCEEGSNQLVSQFDKDDVETVGLVKFDFLGLKTLTIIDWALKDINQKRKKLNLKPININDIPMDDDVSFDLLKACQTTAIFQLESRGMKDLIHRLQPDCFEEIIALVALFRPGPLQSGMVDNFIDRKHGRAPVEYPHPDLESILKPTYGVILYQEQVMQIAQVLANYTLGAADLLRRAMGKKKPEAMAKQRVIFVEGAAKRGIDENKAASIFDLMEKFAGYGFNKSHSAAYALVAYQTAWLKAHYQSEFMAAVMSADLDNTDKVVIFIQECKNLNIEVLPPSINNSFCHFHALDENTIIHGLGAIKGVGEGAVHCLVEERNLNGSFEDLFSLCERLDLRKINRRVLEALIKSGALDEWNIERSVLFASLDKALKVGNQFHQNQNSGQMDLLSMFEEPIKTSQYIKTEPWDVKTRLDAEKDTLGFYVTGHPATDLLKEFKSFINPIERLSKVTTKKVIVGGLVNTVRTILTKTQKKLMILNLEDAGGNIDIIAFSEVFAKLEPNLQSGEVVVIEGELGQDNYTGGLRLVAGNIYRIEDARLRFARSLLLTLKTKDREILPSLQAVLKASKGECLVQIKYANEKASGVMNLSSEWRILPSNEIILKLKQLLDKESVSLCY